MSMWTALHTIWLPNEVLAASPNWTSMVHIRGCHDGHTREDGLSRFGLPLRLYLTRNNRTAAEADADIATHDMVA
jgi:hypothetical protein